MDSQEPLVFLESARKALQAQKQRTDEEIRSYPRPIAACDLQFNYLLEERARIARELGRLHEEWQKLLAGEPPTHSPSTELSQPGQR
jgi:hypothetical protein